MGFTFDQAIQAGLDAPHLGVGIAAGEVRFVAAAPRLAHTLCFVIFLTDVFTFADPYYFLFLPRPRRTRCTRTSWTS